jgi:hypothetical protein
MSNNYDERLFSHVPLTTSMVEQTFSYYKHIFHEKRRNLKVGSLEMLIGLSFNKFDLTKICVLKWFYKKI